tara:strand:- start:1039 stop:1578 length:540 start_codon:yes stop_codon:yes gene_type:complete
VFLGLDISTSITGATIIDDVGQVLYCEAWDTRNKNHFPDLWSKAKLVKGRLLDLRAMFVIEHVFIEQSLQAFRPGFSSAKTLLTLASFNGIVSYICQDQLGVKPEYIGASTARKLNGIKVPRGEKAKQVVLQHILDNESDFVVQYTKQGNPKPGSYDRADSLIIARAGYNLWKEKNSNY